MDKTEIGLLGEQVALHDARRFRIIFECNLLPLIFWHQDGRIRDANDAYLKLIGRSRQELFDGKLRCDRLTPPEHLTRDERAIKELHSGKIVCTPFQKDYLSQDRGRIPVLVGGALLPNRQDEGIAFVLDLTKYSSAEQALHARGDLIHDLYGSLLGMNRIPGIEELTSLKSGTTAYSDKPELGALLTHELSQPLGTILADAQSARRLLRQRTPNLEELRTIVSDIISEDRRASRLIDRVRLIIKKNKGAIRPLNVNRLLGEVIRMLRNQLSASAIQIELALAPELPPVRGDRVQLHQLFVNLLSNASEALKLTAPQSKKLFICTHMERESFVSIDIRDTGTGIPPEKLDAIFAPFVSTKRAGMGVGLYICRSIVESHGGCLWATNHPEGGATFHVCLPAIPAK